MPRYFKKFSLEPWLTTARSQLSDPEQLHHLLSIVKASAKRIDRLKLFNSLCVIKPINFHLINCCIL